MKIFLLFVAVVSAGPLKRNADDNKTWLGGRVPFVIDGSLDATASGLIQGALKSIESQTCLQFKDGSGDFNLVKFTKSSTGKCSSPVGRQGGAQEVQVGAECLTTAGILYHVMSSLGFYPEHTRSDRDQHIAINYNNILQDKKALFNTVKMNTLNLPYDTLSIMQWSSRLYSSNGQPTMTPIKANTILGSAQGLSKLDIQKINSLYGCKPTSGGGNKECCDTKADCPSLGATFCQNAGQFAKERCPKTCGACSGPCSNPVTVPCRDNIGDCDAFDRQVCTYPPYAYWVEKNCKKWCNKC